MLGGGGGSAPRTGGSPLPAPGILGPCPAMRGPDPGAARGGGRHCPEPLGQGPFVTTRLRGRRRDLGALKAGRQLTDSRLWRCFRFARWLLFALTGFEWFLIIDASFSFYLVFAAARKGLAFLH